MKQTDNKSFTIKNTPSEKEKEKEKLMNEFVGGKKTTLEQIFNEHKHLYVVKV